MADGCVVQAKVCTKCLIQKPNTIEFFARKRSGKRLLYARCRPCLREDEAKVRAKPFLGGTERTCNACGIAKPATHEHFQPRKARSSGFRGTCRVCVQKKDTTTRAARGGTPRSYYAAWNSANRDKLKEYGKRAREREGYQTKLSRRISCLVRSRLKSANSRRDGDTTWRDVLGYDVPDLLRHLERQFLRDMTWKNMEKWHIDHIVPVSSFEFSSITDPGFRAAWALTNLRPLWAIENIAKGAKRIFPL